MSTRVVFDINTPGDFQIAMHAIEVHGSTTECADEAGNEVLYYVGGPHAAGAAVQIFKTLNHRGEERWFLDTQLDTVPRWMYDSIRVEVHTLAENSVLYCGFCPRCRTAVDFEVRREDAIHDRLYEACPRCVLNEDHRDPLMVVFHSPGSRQGMNVATLYARDLNERKCQMCRGGGMVKKPSPESRGYQRETCPTCKGSGKSQEDPVYDR